LNPFVWKMVMDLILDHFFTILDKTYKDSVGRETSVWVWWTSTSFIAWCFCTAI